MLSHMSCRTLVWSFVRDLVELALASTVYLFQAFRIGLKLGQFISIVTWPAPPSAQRRRRVGGGTTLGRVAVAGELMELRENADCETDFGRLMTASSRAASLAPVRPRSVGADLLRALAILLVMLWHLPKPATPALLGALKPYGWIGVDLFFVLSGYLIGTQLLTPLVRSERVNLRAFFVRRSFRSRADESTHASAVDAGCRVCLPYSCRGFHADIGVSS
jgi:hypothetical protein